MRFGKIDNLYVAMNSLRTTGILSFLFFGVALFSRQIVRVVFADQDPAGEAMMSGLIAIVALVAALVLALVAFTRARKKDNLDGVTKFLARAPLAIIALAVLAAFLRAMLLR